VTTSSVVTSLLCMCFVTKILHLVANSRAFESVSQLVRLIGKLSEKSSSHLFIRYGGDMWETELAFLLMRIVIYLR